MGNKSITMMPKINFEDVQQVCKNPEMYILINTLPEADQHCLILNTIAARNEEGLINKYMGLSKSIRIIIYGRNTNDDKVYTKYNQLLGLGFTNIYVYLGGMFEWLILQDIYGKDDFPTTSKQLDFLKYKPMQRLNIGLIENGM